MPKLYASELLHVAKSSRLDTSMRTLMFDTRGNVAGEHAKTAEATRFEQCPKSPVERRNRDAETGDVLWDWPIEGILHRIGPKGAERGVGSDPGADLM
jgi:hypothetical protein